MITSRRILLSTFFVSGFLGLVYETLWQKQMIMLLGASAPAVVAILGAFFAGIALGGMLGDAALSRFKVPELRLYAYAELAIALNALAMPLIQKVLHTSYLQVAHTYGATSPAAYSFRFGATMLAVLPATVAMGATIPFMAASLRKYSNEAVAAIYGFNALGAMMGSLAGPLCMVPAFGIRASLLIAFGLNLFVFSVAYTLSLRETGPDLWPKETAAPAKFSWYLAYFAAGAVALGAETTWLRILSMVILNGPILFATTLAVFLGAYAAGSLLVHPFLSRRLGAATESAWVQIGVALFLLATVPVIRFIPNLRAVLVAPKGTPDFPWTLSLFQICAVVLVVFLPALAMGIVFPAMSRITAATGRLYFWGNVGSLFGVLVFGLIGIPFLGLNGSLMALVIISSLIGLGLLPQCTKIRLVALFSCLSAIALWVFLPPYAKTPAFIRQLSDGSYGEFKDGQLENKIIRFKEGQTSTVTIRESVATPNSPAYRRVYVDEQQVAATTPDAKVDSKMLAHLPAMLHPNPQRALSVGYGSGGTSWSLALYDGLQARTVEIEGEILKSAQLFPYREVWKKPNFKVIHNDARDHLQTTDERYDFISTDVTNLQYNQNATLYTVEYFGMMRDRLTKDGIACAWIPMSAISPASFRTLLASFQKVYPHASLWLMNEIPTYFGILIGTKEPLQVDMRRMNAVMADQAVRVDLATIGIQNSYQVAASLLLDEAGMRAFTQGAPLHSDDDPVLEHAASHHNYLYFNDFVSNLDAALKYRPASAANLIVGLNAAQRAEFEKVWVASGHWYETISALSGMSVTSDRPTLNALAARAVVSAREAMRAHRGWRSWQYLYAGIESRFGFAVSPP